MSTSRREPHTALSVHSERSFDAVCPCPLLIALSFLLLSQSNMVFLDAVRSYHGPNIDFQVELKPDYSYHILVICPRAYSVTPFPVFAVVGLLCVCGALGCVVVQTSLLWRIIRVARGAYGHIRTKKRGKDKQTDRQTDR